MLKKNRKIEPQVQDTQKLAEWMDRIIEGDYSLMSEKEFQDATLAAKLNHILTDVLTANTTVAMHMNESMISIGDSGCVKDMIEQVNSQTTAIADMNSSSQDLGASIGNIQDTAHNIQETTHGVMQIADKCVSEMNESITIVDESTSQVLRINEQVADFQEKAVKINEIIDMVKKIAKKSGLLALNASIEAARAGEAGRGFAVVANQIQELSSNTTQSAEDVVRYVNELMEGIEALAESIDLTTKHLQKGNESVHRSVDALNQMNEGMGEISDRIDSIYEEINRQSALTQSFIASVESISESYDTLSRECLTTGDHLYRTSRQVDKLRGDLARGHSNLSLQDWMKVYEVDHLIFTWRVYNHLAGFEKLVITQLNNPQGCKFGKWRCAQTDPRITSSSEFREAVRIHDTLHDYACASWNASEAGDRDEALAQFMKALNQYELFKKAMGALSRFLGTL